MLTEGEARRVGQPGDSASRHGHRLAAARLTTSLEQAAAVRLPGPDISCWSDHLLELFLCYLHPVGLARAARVCRRWYQAASHRSLQVHCFMQSYPAAQRRRLSQALHTATLLQSLRLPGKTMTPGSPQKTQPEWLVEQEHSPQRLFFTLVKHWLHARQLAFDSSDTCIRSIGRSCNEELYSPDGNYLVIRHSCSSRQWRESLSVWSHEGVGLRQLACTHTPSLPLCHGMRFSADSRRLLAVDIQGQLHSWQQEADSSWRALASGRLSPARVEGARFSPDARCLVIQTGGNLLVFAEDDAQQWEQSYSFPLNTIPLPFDFAATSSAEFVQFSADSHHFLFVNTGQAFIFDHCGASWQTAGIGDVEGGSVETAILDAQGSWIAVALRDKRQAWMIPPHHKSLTAKLWHCSREKGWHCIDSRTCVSALMYQYPMAFSPDSRQLAFPDQWSNGDVCVCVLSLAHTGHCKLAAWLTPGPGAAIESPDYPYGITALHYSANGHYLAAMTRAGIQLWQFGQQKHGSAAPLPWVAVSWMENGDITREMRFAFSPDGYHCATAMGEGGHVRVQGPGPDRDYVTKLEFAAGRLVEQLLFAPDATRLLVSCAGPQYTRPGYTTCLRLLAPRTEPDS